MTQNTALGWDTANGEAEKNNITFMKLTGGKQVNRFRIISGIIPRYVYWIKNGEGKPRTFECLAFDRAKERFDNTRYDPVRELGLTQPGEGKQAGTMVPLKCKRSYVCQVINRATGRVEILDLKKSIFDGVKSVCAQLKKSPYEIDIFVEKTGATWNTTEYKVKEIQCLQASSEGQTEEEIQADNELKEEAPDINEQFPVPDAKELKAQIVAWMNSSSADNAEEGNNAANESAQEAVNELED
jgi:hypothetical protein